jgi:periplasmic protein TonB
MKRKNEKVPGFDEIIFENRNKEYGAYDLRKSYNSTTSISIAGGIALCGLLILAFSLSTEKGKASQGPVIDVLLTPDRIYADPVLIDPKPPEELGNIIKNVAPVVTEDSMNNIDLPPITDILVQTEKDKPVGDTAIFEDTREQVIKPDDTPFISVQEMPEYPGGLSELMRYIGSTISYPDEAIANNIQGRVILKFVVNTDGSVDRIQIIKGIDTSLDNEAVRVIKTLNRFKPGKQDGIPVPVWYTIPVLFRLQTN